MECLCGCGQMLINKWGYSAKYVRGHNPPWNKGGGHSLSKQACENISKSLLGRKITWTDKIVAVRKKNNDYGWSKGLTKETNKGVKKQSESCKIGTMKQWFEGRGPKKWFNTIPEQITEKGLLKKGFMIQKQFHVQGVGIVDFYLPEQNIIIEVDGDYYHRLPGAQEKDKDKTEKMINMGYKVLRFWESEVYCNLNVCLERI